MLKRISIPGKTPGTIIKPIVHDSTYQPTIKNSLKQRGHKQKKRYINSIISFDIETTTVNDVAFIWHWQLCIDGEIIVGRSLDDFLKWYNEFIKQQELSKDRRAIFFVHNLSYEFQFMKKVLDFSDIFAVKPHAELSALSKNCVEWRCTYLLTDMSLKKWCETSKKIPFYKQEMTYNDIRTPSSAISREDLTYCVADVLAMWYGLRERLKDDDLYTLPKTATGYVRREFKKTCKNTYEWQRFYERLKLNAESYILYTQAFMGGQVRIAPHFVSEIVPIFSDDITSSYPFRMLCDEFPNSTPCIQENPTFEQYKYCREQNFLYIIDIQIEDVILHSRGLAYIQLSNTQGSCGEKCDNGRVITADALRLVMTSVDFDIVSKNYDFTVAKINRILFHREKRLLPECFRDTVLRLAKMKTELKGVDGKEYEYEQSKRRFNAAYGMTVTRLVRDIVKYDENLTPYIERVKVSDDNTETVQAELDKFYKSRNNFLPYEIGVWVTAYARKEWAETAMQCEDDFVYGDTDSVKHLFDHSEIFNARNDDIYKKALSIYTEDEIAPKDIKGRRHFLGLWDRENTEPTLFLGYGTKKYFTRKADGKESITVAGCRKQAADFYHERGGSVLHAAILDEIPPEYSGRTSAEYVDEEREVCINGEFITSPSCVIIKEVPYTLNITEEHKMYSIIERQRYIKEVLSRE